MNLESAFEEATTTQYDLFLGQRPVGVGGAPRRHRISTAIGEGGAEMDSLREQYLEQEGLDHIDPQPFLSWLLLPLRRQPVTFNLASWLFW